MKRRFLVFAVLCLLGAVTYAQANNSCGSNNTMHCVSGEQSITNPVCDLPIASSGCGDCIEEYGAACDDGQWSDWNQVDDGGGTAECCMDADGDGCCHMCDMTYNCWHHHWWCVVLPGFYSNDSSGDCPSACGLTGGTATSEFCGSKPGYYCGQ